MIRVGSGGATEEEARAFLLGDGKPTGQLIRAWSEDGMNWFEFEESK
jgi:hypothetical protein